MASEEKSFPDGYDEKTTPVGADTVLIVDSVTGAIKWATITKIMANAQAGQNGANGVSISYQGAYTSEAALIAAKGAIQGGWAYRHTGDKKLYIRDLANTTWGTGIADGVDGSNGTNGTNGTNGISPAPQGSYATEAALISAKGAIQPLWVYKNTTDKKTYIRNLTNDAWTEIASDGTDVITVGVGSEINIDMNFTALVAETYKTMRAVIFTSMEYEGSAPTLSIPLNTPLQKYTQLVITPTSLGGVTLKGQIIEATVDEEAPVITAFTIPATHDTLSIPISTFTATDNVAVNGYIVTESGTPPLVTDPAWSITAPTTKTVATEGNKTLFAWAKDAAGNISNYASDSCVVTLPVVQDYLQFTFDSVANATACIGGDPTDPAVWNAFIGGNAAFTSATKFDTADYRLKGGSNVTIPYWKFNTNTHLTKIVDWVGIITHVADFAFLDCTALSILSLKGCLTVGESSFENTAIQDAGLDVCTSIGVNCFKNNTVLMSLYAPYCTTVADYAFNGCTSLLTIRLDSCTALGSSVGNNGVFNNIGQLGGAGNSIVLTIDDSRATCNGGNPDQDITAMKAWNSNATVNYV